MELEIADLQLTEHQKSMLQPTSSRIRDIQYPDAIRKKMALKKAVKRKGVWSSKLRQFFIGKGRKKWADAVTLHGRDLAPDALKLVPKRKPKETARKPTDAEIDAAVKKKYGKALSKSFKAKRWGKAKKKKREEKKGKPILDSEWLAQDVRVVAEVPEEGRCGKVVSVDETKI